MKNIFLSSAKILAASVVFSAIGFIVFAGKAEATSGGIAPFTVLKMIDSATSTPISPVNGNEFDLNIGNVAGMMHTLGISAESTTTPNLPIATTTEFGFYLNADANQQLILTNYFSAKPGWSPAMLAQIGSEIAGSAPFFFLKAADIVPDSQTDGQTYKLVDGFQKALGVNLPDPALVIDDDYPIGIYSYNSPTTADSSGAVLPMAIKLRVKDSILPALSSVSISSNNSSTTLAKIGDVVSLYFTSTKNLQTPAVMIGGNSATVLPGADLKTWTATSTMTGADNDGAISFSASYSDLAGSAGFTTSTTTDGSHILFDKIPPTTSDNYGSKNGIWQNGDQTIILTPFDAGSGIATTKYCLAQFCDPAFGAIYSAPVAFAPEGTNYFVYNSADNAGNVQASTTLAVMIDKTPPSLSNFSVQIPYGNSIASTTINLSASSTDAVSAVGNVIFYYGNAGTATSTALGTVAANAGSYNLNWNTSALNGTYNVFAVATDLAGNQATSSVATTTIDSAAPVITFNSFINPIISPNNPNAATTTIDISLNEKAKIKIGVVDSAGNLANEIYNSGGLVQNPTAKYWSGKNGANNYVSDGIYAVKITATDSAGNTAVDASKTIRFDSTAPAIAPPAKQIFEAASATTTPALTLAGATDIGGSGVASIVPSQTSFALGTTTVIWTAADNAGNSAATSSQVVIVDTTKPAINPQANISDVAASASGKAIAFSLSATDSVSGARAVSCSPNSGDTFSIGTTTVNCLVSDLSGNVATSSFAVFVDSHFTISSSSPNVDLNAGAPNVVIPSGLSATSTISVPSDVGNATIDISSLVNSGDSSAATSSAVLPAAIIVNATTSAGAISVGIPSGLQITAATSSWNGIVNLPTIKSSGSVSVSADSGKSASVSSVIEIGFGDVKLTFDKAARLALAGQAGKYAGYSRAGAFTAITDVCADDSQATGDALPAEGDCKINSGADLVIWTKHFTSFITYTQSAIQASTAVSSGGGNGMLFTGSFGGGTAPANQTASANDNLSAFNSIMVNWGKTGANLQGDLNSDGKVDILDFNQLMIRWK